MNATERPRRQIETDQTNGAVDEPNRLQALYDEQGQSPWLDNLKRGYLTSGELAVLRDRGIRGLTSNPSIFQKAIQGSSDYDDQFGELVDAGQLDRGRLLVARHPGHPRRLRRVRLGVRRVRRRRRLRERRGRPRPRPRRIAGTEAAARDLHERIARRNLMVKIPATAEGLGPIEQMIAEGRNINITLIFSLERYGEVIEAYISGSGTAGRRSRRRPVTGGERRQLLHQPRRHRGRPATGGDRDRRGAGAPWQGGRRPGQARLPAVRRRRSPVRAGTRSPARGARVQRPLWASTSTKNDAYPDTLYVDELIGPHTVNTLPDIDARGVRRSRHPRPACRCRCRRGRGRVGRAGRGRCRHDRRRRTARTRRRRQLREGVRRADHRPGDQGLRPRLIGRLESVASERQRRLVAGDFRRRRGSASGADDVEVDAVVALGAVRRTARPAPRAGSRRALSIARASTSASRVRRSSGTPTAPTCRSTGRRRVRHRATRRRRLRTCTRPIPAVHRPGDATDGDLARAIDSRCGACRSGPSSSPARASTSRAGSSTRRSPPSVVRREVGDPLRRRHVAVQAGHDHADRIAVLRGQRLAVHGDRQHRVTAVHDHVERRAARPPVGRPARQLLGRRPGARPRRGGPSAARPATGRCRRGRRRPGSTRTTT